jgi:predicted RecB family nuclease
MEHQEGSIYENIDSLNYYWITKSLNKKISIELEMENKKARLINLHLHSKHISKSILIMKIIIKLGFSENKSFIWKAGLFDWLVFFERTVSFCNRKILRNNKYEEKILR